jgi:hypothetical protein
MAVSEKDESPVSVDPLRLIFWQSVLAVSVLLLCFVCHYVTYAVPLPALDISFLSPVALLILSSSSHSYSWVKLIDWSGSTGTGLLQGAR